MFEERLDNNTNRRGQVTIFIIIAIVIIGAVAAFFIIRGVVTVAEIPANLEPVYNSFLACIEEDTLVGINMLEAQGGYIELPEFEQGGAYMPFSSQLNFLGSPIPYWYYVSGNNVQKEQVPSKKSMEEALGDYIIGQIDRCVLDEWYGEGYTIISGEDASADVTINEEDIGIVLDMDLRLEKANDTVLVSNHEVVVDSKLGSLYESARNIYDYEQETLFLENYGVDTLRLYAPVDGVEITCSPKVWSADEVFDDLEGAIEANVASIKVETGDLTLRTEEDKYFIVDLPVDENVRFLNSRKWPHSFEVNPSEEGGVMIAKPVGNQPGMAALGFCYVPYHFVYNVNYPVLVQVYSGEEIFQFPFAVVILGNMPREALETEAVEIPDAELCRFRNTQIQINTFDNYFNPVPSNVSFRCFGETCDIGATSEEGFLIEMFPQCVNGYVIAEAEGFQTAETYIESTAQSGVIDVLMNKLYEKRVQLTLDGKLYTDEAVISFISNNSADTLIYPDQNTIELAEDQYEVQVYIYRDAEIKIPETTQEECMEVPRTGVVGFFGLTEEKCFDVVIPEQTINNALLGGGTQQHYLVESELQASSIIDISVESLPTPKSIEDLQENYNILETQGLDITLR
jgi:hypothetical protein